MKVFTIIAGVNGTGKSSFTGALKPQTNDLGVVIDVDKITATHGLTALESGKIAVSRIRECLETGVNFTQKRRSQAARSCGRLPRPERAGIISACTISVSIRRMNRCAALRTASLAAGIISARMMCCAVSPGDGRQSKIFCRTVMKRTFRQRQRVCRSSGVSQRRASRKGRIPAHLDSGAT